MLRLICIASVAILAFSCISRGEVIVTVSQIGSNVVATGTGTIDTASLTDVGSTAHNPNVTPDVARISLGPSGGTDAFQAISGPTTTFGPGDATLGDSATGDIVGVLGDAAAISPSAQTLFLPEGYVSGTPLDGTATWDNTTIAGLGLTPGTYTWTWGTGRTADSFVVQIPQVPEPASLSLIAIGSIALLRRCRRVTRSL